ncbi:MAG: RsmE family RNA methyltransferase [Candidatus Zixiibacteriota bacterium]
MNLIILTDNDRVDEHNYVVRDQRAEHIRMILKLKEGDTLETGLVNGPIGNAVVARVTPDEVLMQCSRWTQAAPPALEIDLICALPRPQTLKKILITSAMMGVRSLHLIRANRVEKSYFQSPLIQPEHQLSFLLEGLSQGKLTRLPLVQVHDRFRRFFEEELTLLSDVPSGPPLRLLCSPVTAVTIDSVYVRSTREVTVAVGPEGGWVPFEVDLMLALGFRSFTLGPWTLRVEHAVTAALAQIELVRAKMTG